MEAKENQILSEMQEKSMKEMERIAPEHKNDPEFWMQIGRILGRFAEGTRCQR